MTQQQPCKELQTFKNKNIVLSFHGCTTFFLDSLDGWMDVMTG